MECELCACDPDPVYLVPFPDGSRDVLACYKCAVAEGVYCVFHDTRHTLFPGSTGCLQCIEAVVRALRKEAKALMTPMAESLSRGDQERVWEWTEVAQNITHDPSKFIAVLRAVATHAHLRKMSVAAVIREVVAGQLSVNDLLPFPF